MPHVRFIRHGQSTANAGAPTADPASIALTALGHAQAQQLADGLDHAPQLIVSSPFLRAQQTAEPSRRRYPETRCETWPIQEFTYLAPARCVHTRAEQRRGWVAGYWHRNDPQAVDGLGAESFAGFIERVQRCLQHLQARSERRIVVFGHGQFMQATRWLIEQPHQHIDATAMAAFRALDRSSPIGNAQGFESRFEGGRWSTIEH